MSYIVTTSASTQIVTTKLNIFQLEEYKKQFQSFWIPFMEQFIPATTIWTAGERWCGEPCTIIQPCDYDYELVASASSITTLTGTTGPTGDTRYWKTDTKVFIKNDQINLGLPKGYKLTDAPNVIVTKDFGLIREIKLGG